jgi:hypothetical protein
MAKSTTPKKKIKNFKKPLDKSPRVWYNNDTVKEMR